MTVRYHTHLLRFFIVMTVLLLICPATSALLLEDSGHTRLEYSRTGTAQLYAGVFNQIDIYKIEEWRGLSLLYYKSPNMVVEDKSKFVANPYYESPVTLKVGSTVVGHGMAYYNCLLTPSGGFKEVQFWIEVHDFNPGTLTDKKVVTIIPDSGTLWNGYKAATRTSSTPVDVSADFPIGLTCGYGLGFGYTIAARDYVWYNEIDVSSDAVEIRRTVNGIKYASNLTVIAGSQTTQDYSANDVTIPITSPATWTVVSPYGKVFSGDTSSSSPGDPGESPTLRTGSVTMTDHNGTPIYGFEVTAVNHYTDEEYTVSTETDVAVITLPMDRTIEIRNPQTGVYEEAPIGYYRFYGQKPGYKMLYEEGIQVSVMPEKYGSYKLCDILVTSDTGPLTGKHQFQLRSWSDNSVLQTGTISAKSRTTGIWYNTTVTNGIATLILPYDTSDAISEYAGHYYVYATSPGYEDIDYGVQIAVYPRTVSEVRSIHLYPIGGVPTPGNVTLRIQAISETGQGVPNAEIFIAGVLGAGKDVWDTYTTSSNGYLAVSVPGNSTYDIVVRGAGYYDSSRRIEVFTEDPSLIEFRLYLSGAPTIEPTTEPTGWVTGPPTTQPTGGIPDEDDDSDGFLMESVRGIANLFGVSFGTGKTILGMLLALGIGTATAKHLRGGAQEFGMGMLGGVVLGVLIGLLPIWVLVLLVLIVGLWIGQRYMSGGDS